MGRTITSDGLAFMPTHSGKNVKWWCVLCQGKNSKHRRTAASVADVNDAWSRHLLSVDHQRAIAVKRVTDMMDDA